MDEELSALPATTMARARRGRKPRRIVHHEPDGKPVFFSALEIREENYEGAAILRLSGTLDTETLITLRDSAFTAIGIKPTELCLDLRCVTLPLGRQVMETLVTIGRVARMLHVGFSVMVPSPLDALWSSAGLNRVIPLQCDPKYYGA